MKAFIVNNNKWQTWNSEKAEGPFLFPPVIRLDVQPRQITRGIFTSGSGL
jgi:hypothetical protein